MRNKTLFVMLVFGLVFSTSGFAKIYKWTDANGKTHYTATPPPSKTKVLSNKEFKVRKAPKSSLKNLGNNSANLAAKDTKNSAIEKKVDKKQHARAQCSKAIGKAPAFVNAVKRQLQQGIKSGKVPESKMAEFERQRSAGKLKPPTLNKCIKNYMAGGASQTDTIADNNASNAISMMQLQMAFGQFR